jgi:hypothetical protein
MSDAKRITNHIDKNDYSTHDTSLSSFDIANNNSIELEFPTESLSLQEGLTKRIGKCYVFCYTNGTPLIVIGPDCKMIYFLNIINKKL